MQSGRHNSDCTQYLASTHNTSSAIPPATEVAGFLASLYEDYWRACVEMAHHFADAVNRHGGDATVVELPDLGLRGNTHFPFSDLNNVEVADVLSKWLAEKNLD